MKTSLWPAAALILGALVIPLGAQTPPASPQAGPAPSGSSTPGKGTIIERVLVRVNSEILTQTQLTQHQIDAWRSLHPDSPVPDDATLAKQISEITPDVLVSAVNDLLLLGRAKELDIKYTDDMFKTFIERVKKEQSLTDADVQREIQNAGGADELRATVSKGWMIYQVQVHEIADKMNLTEQERRQYYNTHKEEFMTPATVTLRQLFLNVASPANDAGVRARIEELRTRATNGEDFAALVQEFSDGSKLNGGMTPSTEINDDMQPDLRAALATMKTGDLTPPLRLAKGYLVVKLEAKTDPELQPYDQVFDKIAEQIFNDRRDTETQKLIGHLKDQAVIEWKDDGFRQMYEKKSAELKKS